jgi:UDP-N-acetylglucosamine diphosphorylase/glucosamine-1-phosphate N-acetyltransferase
MARTLMVFEDERISDLHPLTLARPAWDLVCGILRLKEKLLWGLQMAAVEGPAWRDFAGDRLDLRFHMRDYLSGGYGGAIESYETGPTDSKLASLVNGRLLFDRGITRTIDPAWEGRYVYRGDLVWANVPADRLGDLRSQSGRPISAGAFSDLESRPVDARLVRYPWDLIKATASEMEGDFRALGSTGVESDLPAGVHLLGEDRIRIGRSVNVSPGVVIDATAGPVSIDGEVTVMANAALQGPIHIGRGSIIKIGARIYGETSIGPGCKVGGEVGESTILGHTNKQHDGFLGHSYICEWVNIGAGTDTSDMKNNYSTVRVGPPGREEDSGELFVGLFIGDHSKCGIGTTFNTGSVVGVCCNVFGAGYPPKYIPSFCWGGSAGFTEHDLEKAVRTAGKVMQRRGKGLDARWESILRRVFQASAEERRSFLKTPL